jgi:hypothetical protein
MQHRSLIFWLLLAATLAIDSVSVSWVCLTTLDQAGNLYFGLVCSQISVVCIACCLSLKRGPWRWIAPCLLSIAVAAFTTWLRQREDTDEAYQELLLYLSLWLPQVAILLFLLWLVRQTSLADRWDLRNDRTSWQFSMGHLLTTMTASAILLAILRLAEEMHQFWAQLAAWTINNVTLAIAALMICTTHWYGLLRLGAIVGVSLVLAVIIGVFTEGHPDSILVNIIQVIILFSWLTFGDIVPKNRPFSDDENADSILS